CRHRRARARARGHRLRLRHVRRLWQGRPRRGFQEAALARPGRADRERATVAQVREEIERECARLVLRSLRVFDERDWSAYAALSTEDGVFIRANTPEEPIVGREA